MTGNRKEPRYGELHLAPTIVVPSKGKLSIILMQWSPVHHRSPLPPRGGSGCCTSVVYRGRTVIGVKRGILHSSQNLLVPSLYTGLRYQLSCQCLASRPLADAVAVLEFFGGFPWYRAFCPIVHNWWCQEGGLLSLPVRHQTPTPVSTLVPTSRK